MEGCQIGWTLAGWFLNLESVPPAHACVPKLSYMFCQQQIGQEAPQGDFSSPQQGLWAYLVSMGSHLLQIWPPTGGSPHSRDLSVLCRPSSSDEWVNAVEKMGTESSKIRGWEDMRCLRLKGWADEKFPREFEAPAGSMLPMFRIDELKPHASISLFSFSLLAAFVSSCYFRLLLGAFHAHKNGA